MKILIFGGSFDPIHLGHVNIVKNTIEYIGVDFTIIIPTKVSHGKRLDSSSQQRIEMLEIA
ncbi:MAG: adenylyltransferase/cytidyltransferase family protein, partial [Mycoplasma sp.]